MKPFIKYIFLYSVILFLGCSAKETVRVDIDRFVKDQASYTDKDVVITATLEDIVKRNDLYRGKRIELSAPFSYFGSNSFWTWYILLQKNEHTLRCFTNKYRVRPTKQALFLLARARGNSDPITVIGVLYKDGLDLEEFTYDGVTVRPDLISPRR